MANSTATQQFPYVTGVGLYKTTYDISAVTDKTLAGFVADIGVGGSGASVVTENMATILSA